MINTRSRGGEELPSGAAYLVRRLLLTALCALSGFMLSRTGISEGIYPFATALISALPYGGGIFAAILGAAAGYVSGTSYALRLAATAAAAGGIRWALENNERVSGRAAYPMWCAAGATVLTGAVTAAWNDISGWIYILTLAAEGMAAGAAAYFMAQTFGAAESIAGRVTASGRLTAYRLAAARSAFDELSARVRTACVITLCIFAVPLCRMTLGGFAFFSAVTLFAALVISRRSDAAGGTLAGTCAGVILAVAGGDIGYIGVCAAACLAASLISPGEDARIGRFISSATFAAVCIMASLMTGKIDVFFIVETLLASSVAPLLPDRLFYAQMREDAELYNEKENETFENAVTARLNRAADGLCGISDKVLEVSSRLDDIDTENAHQACRQAAIKVCDRCGMYNYCWGEKSGETAALLDSYASGLKEDTAPGQAPLSVRCIKWGELSGTVTKLYGEYEARERTRRRVSRVRMVMAKQLECVSGLLRGLADGAGETDEVMPSLRSCIYSAAEKCGFEPADMTVSAGKDGRLRIVVDISGCEPQFWERLLDTLRDELGFELCASEDKANERLEISRAAPLCVSFGACQSARSAGNGEKNENILCGDAYDALLIPGDRAALLLSDGMGTGGRAAIDAAMTCGLMRQLLTAGFDAEGAMGMANSALMLRSEDEALSTADCAEVDLFTGRTVFSKAGAAASFIMRDGEVSVIYDDSLPLGIMNDVESVRVERDLRPGDVIVMVSDGVIGEGECAWLRELLLGFDEYEDTRRLAREIVSRAGNDDDMTAMVARLERRS